MSKPYKTPRAKRKKALAHYYQNQDYRNEYGRIYTRNKGNLDWHCTSPGCTAHFANGMFADKHRKMFGHKVVPI